MRPSPYFSIIWTWLLKDYWSGFQMTVEKPKPKQLLRPITTGTNIAMNQSEFVAIIPVTRSKRGKNHAYMVRLVLVLLLIGWTTGPNLLSQSLSIANRNHVITFDSHLKTALKLWWSVGAEVKHEIQIVTVKSFQSWHFECQPFAIRSNQTKANLLVILFRLSSFRSRSTWKFFLWLNHHYSFSYRSSYCCGMDSKFFITGQI